VDTTTPLLFLSEILTGSGGGIEIFNGGTAVLSLSGWSITDNAAAPGKYELSGELAAGAWLTLPASQSGIALSPDGGLVFLFQGGTQRDVITFGPQARDHSLGRTGRERLWSPGTPTPHAANTALESGPADSLRLNEWSAGAAGWIELVNTDAKPVILDGLRLSSNVAGGASYVFPAHSLIAPGGFLVLTAPGHLPFGLDSSDGILTLLDGVEIIDSVRMSRAVPGSSEGRTGAGQVVFFQRPTPGAPNGQAAPVTFAEWMNIHGVAAAADDDLDGHTSFAEYAFATNPRDARSLILPVLSDPAPDGSLRFSFALPQPARADVACTVESTTSLAAGPWMAIATRPGTGAWTGSATVTAGLSEGGFESISVRVVPAAGVITFYRLKFSAL
jgi:hypothetical protein